VFELELHLAECEFLTGELAPAENRLSALLGRAGTVVHRAAVTHLRQALYTTLNRPDRAIDVGLEYLRHVGIEWSREPSEEDVRRELERMRQLLDGRAIEQLIDLPLMTDLRRFLHHQASGNGGGARDQSLNRRKSRRQSVGNGQSRPRCDVSVCSASRRG
jgi:predicted ATPase